MTSRFHSTSNQRWINVVYFNVDLNNARQRQNSVVIFDVDFHNVVQLGKNVVNMTIWKKEINPLIKGKINFLSFSENSGVKICYILFPILREYVKEYLQSSENS